MGAISPIVVRFISIPAKRSNYGENSNESDWIDVNTKYMELGTVHWAINDSRER